MKVMLTYHAWFLTACFPSLISDICVEALKADIKITPVEFMKKWVKRYLQKNYSGAE